jgi:hypothetical protein
VRTFVRRTEAIDAQVVREWIRAEAALVEGNDRRTSAAQIERRDQTPRERGAVDEIDEHQRRLVGEKWERPVRTAWDTDCHAPFAQRIQQDPVRFWPGAQEQNE